MVAVNKLQFKSWLQQFSANNHEYQKPLIMGILNVTPDSFSDGGQYFHPEQALKHALALIDAGVDIIDIGGESSIPGANPISAEEELARVITVIKLIRQYTSTCISIDTTKAIVMREAIEAG